jgi:hypothetical protein
MDLRTRRSDYVPGSNHTWLASAHATDTGDTVTVDLSTFDPTLHYPAGIIPSGMPVGKITASGNVGRYDPAAGDGREVMIGHLFQDVAVNADNAEGYALGSLLRHCQVREARLPANHGLDDAGKAAVAGQIIYV